MTPTFPLSPLALYDNQGNVVFEIKTNDINLFLFIYLKNELKKKQNMISDQIS